MLSRFHLILFLLVFVSGVSSSQNNNVLVRTNHRLSDTIKKSDDTIPLKIKCLMSAYPDFIKGYEDDSLVWLDGSKMQFDDGLTKDFEKQLNEADVEDMFLTPYDTTMWSPSYLKDPGRARNESFFRKMYGNTSAEVQSHLVHVNWFGQKILFTSLNGAADSLRAVIAELSMLPQSYKKYFEQSSSFYWRKVRGANRLSAHSYGIAIDICAKYSDYWLWANPGKKEKDEIVYKNRVPREIITIFERHGFISGARWYHFDTMHFEFRPEIRWLQIDS
ncbi:MAG: M15 family metallopeptidase [Paludibacteraceae bacterium]|nr:M15 family metallopeptidase [Paludibacteraceae bacterium]